MQVVYQKASIKAYYVPSTSHNAWYKLDILHSDKHMII